MLTGRVGYNRTCLKTPDRSAGSNVLVAVCIVNETGLLRHTKVIQTIYLLVHHRSFIFLNIQYLYVRFLFLLAKIFIEESVRLCHNIIVFASLYESL